MTLNRPARISAPSQKILFGFVCSGVGRYFDEAAASFQAAGLPPPPKLRRHLTGKTRPVRPVATFGGGDFPQASGCPGPSLLRRPKRAEDINRPRLRRPKRAEDINPPRVILCGPPLQRDVVETTHSIESKRGFPLWVPYAWNVRAVGRHPHLCSVCREL